MYKYLQYRMWWVHVRDGLDLFAAAWELRSLVWKLGLPGALRSERGLQRWQQMFFFPFPFHLFFSIPPPFKRYFLSLRGIWQQAGTRLLKWGVPSPGCVFCPLLVATEGIVTKLWSQGSGVLGPFSRFSENAGHKNISKVSLPTLIFHLCFLKSFSFPTLNTQKWLRTGQQICG